MIPRHQFDPHGIQLHSILVYASRSRIRCSYLISLGIYSVYQIRAAAQAKLTAFQVFLRSESRRETRCRSKHNSIFYKTNSSLNQVDSEVQRAFIYN